MCVVSMVGDFYRDRFVLEQPHWQNIVSNPVSRDEFDALKREIETMKALLIKAKQYDDERGERNCETDEKFDLLRKIADAVGVDLEDVLAKKRK